MMIEPRNLTNEELVQYALSLHDNFISELAERLHALMYPTSRGVSDVVEEAKQQHLF